jgi:hypothetical protein
LDAGLAEIAGDRSHGAGYLARKALGILHLAPVERRAEIAARLSVLRPAMPAIEAAIGEAMDCADVRAVIQRGDAERRRVARAAIGPIAGRRVGTISNSSLVARALIYARPTLVQIVVAGPDDEGHLLASDLRTAGLDAETIAIDQLEAELAVVGCDAVFEDGSFINRLGTAALVARLPTLVLVDRWKRLDHPPPGAWPEPERFEIVQDDSVRAPA